MVEEIWRTAVVDGEPYENYQVSNLGKNFEFELSKYR